ncbi:MAG: site-2 protease family protein [Nanoarchaeota archaeon]|nr:site-2 protease family protein [Nanoarchaeota archaeon]
MKDLRYNWQSEEKKDLFKSWFILSLAFAILLSGREFSLKLLYNFIISALTVGFGFILHESAHKLLAQKYNCQAVFKADIFMLAITLISSLFGFIFAAPGAVYIKGLISKKRRGLISLAGPLTNIILALIFLIIFFFAKSGLINIISTFGFRINGWLAVFNLLPFSIFDGKKIFDWNKAIWTFTLIASIFLVFILPVFIQGL